MQKLELTWIGKNEKHVIEPRILLHDPSKDYGDKDTENMLIHGDNLLALKALEQKYTGKIKCIYIDPPYNTGARIDADGKEIGFDDNTEHSIWLNLMNRRLEILHKLLMYEGVIFVQIDDKELVYLKMLMDEIWGRKNFLNMIVVKTSDPSGLKTVNPSPYSQTEYILMYAKDRTKYVYETQYVPCTYDIGYNRLIVNRDRDYTEWKSISIVEAILKNLGIDSLEEAKKIYGKLDFEQMISEFAFKNSRSVYQATAISKKAGRAIVEGKELSLQNPDKVVCVTRDTKDDVYILNGRQIYFYENKIHEVDGKKVVTKPLTNLWIDIPWNGISGEGKVTFANSKKPEKLLKRIIEMTTNENDIVLDSFLGSGTTAAVAHKMKRKWIGIEFANHCYSHCKERLDRVIDGDRSGISKIVNWQGGGGYKFYELAPSLIEKDKHGMPVFSKQYNPAMLAAAVAKINGYVYAPDKDVFWKQGYSHDNSFIYVTTQYFTGEMLDSIAFDLGPMENLLICASAFDIGLDRRYDNITVRKIPQTILDKCEYGITDEYNLNIVNPPVFEDEELDDDE